MQSDADEEVVAIFKPLHLYINFFCISREGGFYFYEIYIETFLYPLLNLFGRGVKIPLFYT